MIEIIVLMLAAKRIGAIAQRKGHSPALFKVLLVALWFGFELVGYIAGLLFFRESEFAQLVAYPVAIAGAALGAWLAFVIAGRLPEAVAIDGSAPRIQDIQPARTFSALFDPKILGLNWVIGFFYFLGHMLMQFTWMIMPLLNGQSVGFMPLPYYGLMALTTLIEAGLFVAALHLIRSEGALIVVWGLITSVMQLATFTLLMLLVPDLSSPIMPWDPMRLIRAFIYGACMLAGPIAAVRLLGPRSYALIAGGAVSLVAINLIHVLVMAIERGGQAMDGMHLIVALLNGVLYGTMLYVGIYVHPRGRQALMAQGPPSTM